MSENLKPFSSDFRLNSARAQEERPVVLPFPGSEAAENGRISREPAFSRVSGNGHALTRTLPLIARLCLTLNAKQIAYCHWKSNWKLNRWLNGEGDLDLLIARADAQRFVSIACSLGFKQAEPPSDRSVPGILNFYGFDSKAGKFVHLHVHYQLVIGHDLTKNYHLPVENLCLDLARRHRLIPIPAPEFELIVFVLRMVLKYSVLETSWRRMFDRSERKANAVEQELEQLEVRIDRARVANLLPRIVPGVENAFFETCLQSLRSGNSFWTRMSVRWELQRRLQACARRPQTMDAVLKIGRRLMRMIRERLLKRSARKRLVNGGLLIAVVGGDGAGKTTALNALDAWLSRKFVTKRFHVGKPPRSPVTLALIVSLRILRLLTNVSPHPERQLGDDASPFPGYLQLFRWVSAGRDRCRLYITARRFATNGGIALCDRYPLPQVRLMEGPNIARTVNPRRRNALVKRLLRAESNYYRKIMAPDLLIVLRVDPEVAVRRKTTESEQHVRRRSGELWEQNWQETNAHIIDANQPAADVLAQAQSIIWAKL